MTAVRPDRHPGAGRRHRGTGPVSRPATGHTEGLEPHITEKLVSLMVAAPGGKLQTAGSAAAAPGAG